MYKNIVAAVLGINGLLLLVIGGGMIARVSTQLAGLGLGSVDAEAVSVTYYALGASDAGLSLFSLVAAVFVFKGSNAGRVLAIVVGANLILVGVGIFSLTGAMFGLYFIGLRGLIIVALAWMLKLDSA